MKKYFAFLFLLFCISSFSVLAQEKEGSYSGVKVTKNRRLEVDTTLKVEYKTQMLEMKYPVAYYLNDEFIQDVRFLKPEYIKSINVQHDTVLVNGYKHYGCIYVVTQKDYQIQPISLIELKAKFTNIGDAKVIYFVDDKFVDDSYDRYLVNELDLMRIYVEKSRNPEIADYIIRILTNKEENVNALRNPVIYIRGNEKCLSE